MATKVQLRRDTAANWTTQNPVLAQGEFAVVSDQSDKMKIGDGTTNWGSLGYFNPGAGNYWPLTGSESLTGATTIGTGTYNFEMTGGIGSCNRFRGECTSIIGDNRTYVGGSYNHGQGDQVFIKSANSITACSYNTTVCATNGLQMTANDFGQFKTFGDMSLYTTSTMELRACNNGINIYDTYFVQFEYGNPLPTDPGHEGKVQMYNGNLYFKPDSVANNWEQLNGGGSGWPLSGTADLTGDVTICGVANAYSTTIREMHYIGLYAYGVYDGGLEGTYGGVYIGSYSGGRTRIAGDEVYISSETGNVYMYGDTEVCIRSSTTIDISTGGTIQIGGVSSSVSDYFALQVPLATGGVVTTRDLSVVASDATVKENIEVIGECTLDRLTKIDPVSFNWKPSFSTIGDSVYGMIAQEVEKEFPNLVKETTIQDQTIKGIKYKEWTPILIKSIQELSEEVDALKKQVNQN